MRVAVLILALLASRPARGDEGLDALLARARDEKTALRYRDALATLDEALRLGRARPGELREILVLAGEMAAGLGDAQAATGWFARLLAIAPGTTLPVGTSPKITGPFEDARASLAGRALRVRFEAPARGGGALVMVVEDDPLGLVAGARARVVDRGQEITLAARGSERAELALPRGAPLLATAVVDAQGNELVRGRVVVLGETPAAGAPARRSIFARWWLWGATSVALAGAGLVFGSRMQAAQDEFDAIKADSMNHTLAEAEAVATRGERWALAANASFVLAGVTGIVAAVLAVRGLGDGGERDVILAPESSHGGIELGVVLRGRF